MCFLEKQKLNSIYPWSWFIGCLMRHCYEKKHAQTQTKKKPSGVLEMTIIKIQAKNWLISILSVVHMMKLPDTVYPYIQHKCRKGDVQFYIWKTPLLHSLISWKYCFFQKGQIDKLHIPKSQSLIFGIISLFLFLNRILFCHLPYLVQS